METALGWIGDSIRWLFSLLPHLVLIRSTHRGVAFKWGKHIKELPPGLHWYVPIITDVDVIPVVKQPVDLHDQRLWTLDNQTVTVGGVILYEITDVVSLYENCSDEYDTIVSNKALSVIKSIVTQKTLSELRDDQEQIDLELAQTLNESLEESYGVNVVELTLSDIAPCIVICTR